MFEIIMYLFESYIQIDQTIEIDPQEITDELLEEGFQRKDISKALTWLDSLAHLQDQSPEKKVTQASPHSFRSYTKEEGKILSPRGQGYILQLESAEILTTHMREVVIEYALALDTGQLSLHDLKWLILMVLFNDPESSEEFLQLESLLFDLDEGLLQ